MPEQELLGAQAPGPAQRYDPALDGVRGVAILLVLAYHLSLSLTARYHIGNSLAPGKGGWCGVDVFFVLSGYLITDILLHARTKAHYFRNFYARRALRIFPLYLVAIGVAAVLTRLSSGRGTSTHSLLWVLLFQTNIVQSLDATKDFGYLNHFWSLAVEEHFYLFWPLAVFALSSNALMRLAVVLIVTALALRTAWVLLDPRHYAPYELGPWYMLTPMRMDALAGGALIAMLGRRGQGLASLLRPAKVVILVAGLALTLLVTLTRELSPSTVYMSTIGYSLLTLFFGSALLLAVRDERARRLVSAPLLRWLGRFSYGIYVWHFICFVAVFHTGLGTRLVRGDGPIAALFGATVALAATAALTLSSWFLLEAPLLKLKHYFAE